MSARTLIAGIGYRNLRDYSLGVVLSDVLAERQWPMDVVVEDLSYNPIAVVQRLDDEPEPRRFARAIFVSAVSRGTRFPGTLTAYRWDGVLPSSEEVQRAIADAVTGIIHLDNTLIVARHFATLPDETAVIEVEPFAHEFGDGFSSLVEEAFHRAFELVTSVATDHAEYARLPVAPLGGVTIAQAAAKGSDA